MRCLPTAVEPVKENLRMSGWLVSAAPISAELRVVNIDSKPFGRPARSASSAMARADSGVSLAGLVTIAHPAASAGAALRVIIAIGKFQGVIAAATPTGCLITR